MNKNIIKTLFISFVLVFSMAFINMIEVKATEREYCDLDKDYIKAISCDYSVESLGSFKSTIAFAKSTDGGVCAEVKNVSINAEGPISQFFQISEREQRGVLAFDVEDNTIEKSLSSNSCPQLKLVNDFDYFKGTTTKITFSDKITPGLDDVRCFVSGNLNTTVNGSQCWLVDGKNYKAISVDTFRGIVDSSNSIRDSVEDINPDKIKYWGDNFSDNEFKPNYSGNCDLIPDTIKDIIKNLFFIIQIIGIILLVVLSMVEFIKALTGENEDGIKQALKNTFKRIILVVILLILPSLIIWILNIVNDNRYVKDNNGNYVIGSDNNPLCK